MSHVWASIRETSKQTKRVVPLSQHRLKYATTGAVYSTVPQQLAANHKSVKLVSVYARQSPMQHPHCLANLLLCAAVCSAKARHSSVYICILSVECRHLPQSKGVAPQGLEQHTRLGRSHAQRSHERRSDRRHGMLRRHAMAVAGTVLGDLVVQVALALSGQHGCNHQALDHILGDGATQRGDGTIHMLDAAARENDETQHGFRLCPTQRGKQAAHCRALQNHVQAGV